MERSLRHVDVVKVVEGTGITTFEEMEEKNATKWHSDKETAQDLKVVDG